MSTLPLTLQTLVLFLVIAGSMAYTARLVKQAIAVVARRARIGAALTQELAGGPKVEAVLSPEDLTALERNTDALVAMMKSDEARAEKARAKQALKASRKN